MGCNSSKPGAGDTQSNPIMSEPEVEPDLRPYADRLQDVSVDKQVGAAKEIREKATGFGDSAVYKAFITRSIANGTVPALVKALRETQHDQLLV